MLRVLFLFSEVNAVTEVNVWVLLLLQAQERCKMARRHLELNDIHMIKYNMWVREKMQGKTARTKGHLREHMETHYSRIFLKYKFIWKKSKWNHKKS